MNNSKKTKNKKQTNKQKPNKFIDQKIGLQKEPLISIHALLEQCIQLGMMLQKVRRVY